MQDAFCTLRIITATMMSTKELIRSLAANNRNARLFSAQMLMAARNGTNPTVIIDGKRIRLVRTMAQKSVNPPGR